MNTVAFHTLGCKLNFSETSTLARQFRSAGWKRVEFPEAADVYVVNTCSVTENADKECRSIVTRAMTANPDGKMIIVGCYAQLKPDEIAAIPGVDLVLGATEKFNVLNYLAGLEKSGNGKVLSCEISAADSFISAWSSGDRTRTFLKVQDGCDYNCSFCTIPLARGRSRSNSIKNVLEQVKELTASGVQEIILTGVNLGDFGILNEQGKHEENFTDLVRALETIGSLKRLRFSSVEPNLLTEDVIRLAAQSKNIMPHFHMPLQSGSDEILGKMRRRYKRDLYQEKVNLIKSLIPHASIGVDVIVGFPGETEEYFEATYNFLQQLPVSYFHVFTYSERNDTLAAQMDQVVPMPVRKYRNSRLRNLSAKKSHDFTVENLGKVRPVLFEAEENEGVMFGYTSNYIRIEHPFRTDFVNRIVDCELEEIGNRGLVKAAPVLAVKNMATFS